jgi:hypothetical protein
MDVYKKGQFVLANQVHDFNPGIPPSGLFWVQAVPEDALEVNLQAGTATLALTNLVEGDFHNVQNAILGGAGDPGSVSFKMKWTTKSQPMNVTDQVNRFTGRFQISTVQIEWSAKAPNFTFVSDSAATTVDVASVMGRERNGIFFDE